MMMMMMMTVATVEIRRGKPNHRVSQQSLKLFTLLDLCVCVCHPCAGALLIFSASFQLFNGWSPKGIQPAIVEVFSRITSCRLANSHCNTLRMLHRPSRARIAHYECIASAKMTAVLREAMLFLAEPAWSAVNYNRNVFVEAMIKALCFVLRLSIRDVL